MITHDVEEAVFYRSVHVMSANSLSNQARNLTSLPDQAWKLLSREFMDIKTTSDALSRDC